MNANVIANLLLQANAARMSLASQHGLGINGCALVKFLSGRKAAHYHWLIAGIGD